MIAEEDHQFTTDFLKKIVSINSVNPEMDPESKGEYELSLFLKDEMENLGLEVLTQKVETKARPIERQNIIARLRAGGRKSPSTRTLMFNSHMDTVPVSSMKIAPFDPVVKDGFLYGRGSSDMKSGLAASISALHSLIASDTKLEGDVLLVFACGEEYLSMGTETLIKEYTADAAIVGEPSNLTLGLAHKGFVWLEVEIFGKPAHGSVPEVGVDAIEKASKLVMYVNGPLRSKLNKKRHPLVGEPKIHPSTINGGLAWNIIPDYCKLNIERRTIPGESAEAVLKEIEEAIIQIRRNERAPAQKKFTYEIRKNLERAPLETRTEESIVLALRKAYKRMTKRNLKITGMPYWTDAAFLSRPGNIPSVVIGPGIIEEAHTASEKVSLRQVFDAVELYRETMIEYLNHP